MTRRLLEPGHRRHVAALALLAAVMLLGRIQNEVLFSVDGIAYAVVGKELASRPLGQWAILTWRHRPFYEHPHLTPWLLGGSIRLLGTSTLAAVFPIALLSLVTVLAAYRLGALLIDHRYGLLAATVLVLTPQFVKNGRNPMLEPALMLFVTLTVYYHLRHARDGRWRDTWLAGMAFGGALLAKGPPAMLAVAVITGFEMIALRAPRSLGVFRMPPRRFWPHLGTIILMGAGAILLLDLWHRALTGESFVLRYLASIRYDSPSWNRGPETNDPTFYIPIFFSYWPWLPLVLVSLPLTLWRRDGTALPALTVGGLWVAGTFLGFTLVPFKASWYVTIHYVGSSLLAGLALRPIVSDGALSRHYARSCAVLAVAILFLSASFPSLFQRHPRPLETFMENARVELRSRLEGQAIADCVGLDPWKGSLFLSYYLDASPTSCEDSGARVRFVDYRRVESEPLQRLLFARHPFALVEQEASRP